MLDIDKAMSEYVPTESVRIDELSVGDVVHRYGLLLRVDGRATTYGPDPVVLWRTTITNPEYVAAHRYTFAGLVGADNQWPLQAVPDYTVARVITDPTIVTERATAHRAYLERIQDVL